MSLVIPRRRLETVLTCKFMSLFEAYISVLILCSTRHSAYTLFPFKIHIILRSLLGLTRLNRQRNPEIRNSLKVGNIVEDIKQYQRRWVDHLERMDRSRLPRLAFQYQPQGWRDRGRPRARWKDQEHLELQRNRS
jgi:hypothetical protein